MKREELMRKFDAVDEAGNVYTICEFTEYDSVQTLKESDRERSPHRLALEDGSAVNQVGGFYEVVNTGAILREVDLPE